ncbi:rhotekin-2 [Calliopsis andreniformis]|uniref:rhotekin-2 n=1 Tax=Calliopsis andreniformis TaxID=337506 RepID=UPI003FCD5EAE
MAPRRKSIGTLRGSLNGILDKENNYLRSLSDYQARVRRRESIRNCKNIAEHDLEKKIELEIKMREGSSRILAAARHPTQSLEAARALLTSSKRMSAYMSELQHRRQETSSKTSICESKGKLSISDLRIPLMWRDSDHFKNRGDHRRFAVFCLARVGTEIHDTSLLYPIDREQTDISFSDLLLFNNVPADFELILEIYSHVSQEDLSIASTPRRIRRSIHSSISKTVGKKFVASLRDEYDSSKNGPQFDLVAYAKLKLDDSDGNIRTHDLMLNNIENKLHALPLFGHFCCRLAVQPDCIDKEIHLGSIIINDQRCWARLRNFQIDCWKSKKSADESQEPTCTICVNRETVVRRPKSMNNQLCIINRVVDSKTRDVIEFSLNEDADKWFKQLTIRVNELSNWKHAAVNFQRIPCSDNCSANTSTKSSFVSDKQQGSLYDEIPLIGSHHSGLKYASSNSINFSMFYFI